MKIIQAQDMPPSPAHPYWCGCEACLKAKFARQAPDPTWLVDESTGRAVCSAVAPRPHGAQGQWVHPDAACTYSGEYAETYQCPHCDVLWAEELPE